MSGITTAVTGVTAVKLILRKLDGRNSEKQDFLENNEKWTK